MIGALLRAGGVGWPHVVSAQHNAEENNCALPMHHAAKARGQYLPPEMDKLSTSLIQFVAVLLTPIKHRFQVRNERRNGQAQPTSELPCHQPVD